MSKINNLFLYLSLFFFSIYFKSATACACFNSGFLSSIFTDSKNVYCNGRMSGNQLIGLRISDTHNQAFSDSTGCTLSADYHNITRSYEPMTYGYENNNCISEIYSAYKSVNAQMTYN